MTCTVTQHAIKEVQSIYSTVYKIRPWVGLNQPNALTDCATETWLHVISIKYTSKFHCFKHLVPIYKSLVGEDLSLTHLQGHYRHLYRLVQNS